MYIFSKNETAREYFEGESGSYWRHAFGTNCFHGLSDYERERLMTSKEFKRFYSVMVFVRAFIALVIIGGFSLLLFMVGIQVGKYTAFQDVRTGRVEIVKQ